MRTRLIPTRLLLGAMIGRPGQRFGRAALVTLCVLLAMSTVEVAGQSGGSSAGSAPTVVDEGEIARGAYLARAADCAACHSVPGTPAFTGGLPMNSPLGTIYSTNITPDPETGIGTYSLHEFDDALRKGRAPNHRLYPAMPYPSFAKASDEDIRALYSYFMHGVAPVRRVPPRTKLPFPFDQRWAVSLWNVAFLDSQTYRADPAKGASWNRGAYLVQGLGHCGACHTPRGIAYEEHGYTQESKRYLTGGINDHWLAPNLTGAPAVGLADWSKSDIVGFLRTGHTTGRMAFGPMSQVVSDSLQHLDTADLEAIAAYLKSFGPRVAGGSFRPDTQSRATEAWLATGDVHVPGGGLYDNFCAKCHQADGRGAPDKAPALAQSALVRAVDPDSVIHILLSGGKPTAVQGMAPIDPMPAFGPRLNDREIAEVASFVRRSWGNNAPPVTPRQVAQMRAAIAIETK